MKDSLLIIVFFFFLSCRSKNQEEKIDMQLFSFTAPKKWKAINDDGIPPANDATFRKRFHNENGKLIYIEYGLSGSGERFAPYPIPAYRRAGYLAHNFDTSGWIFSDDPRLSELKEKSTYEYSNVKVAGFPAYVYNPKNYGKGYSGVYIDSTGVEAGNLIEFAVYGENLDSLEIIQLKKVFSTLEIRPFDK